MLITKAFKSLIMGFKGKLDCLIICHGINNSGTLDETMVDEFDYFLNINIRSCFHLISIASPFLKLTKGTVVAISSYESKIPTKFAFLNCVTKNMLNSLIKNAALELAPVGVRFNAVSPGIVNTKYRISQSFDTSLNKEYMRDMSPYFLLNQKVNRLLR